MTDLFTYRDEYPNSPGYKRPGTSREAAEAIKPRAAILRERSLAALKHRPMTADEVAAHLGESVLSIRPRITELHELGLIEQTGERRRNASGRMAAVWRLK
jgi:predicted ArsR family transcriptional regulator